MIGFYLDFFTSCIERGDTNILLQGGRRSGKTFSTFKWLSSIGDFVGGLNILVVCGSFPQLQSTMQDFRDCLNINVTGNMVNGYSAANGLGTLWQFRNIDAKEKAQGVKCDILFVNEAVNVEREVIETLSVGVRWFKIYNFNPTKKSYVQELVNEERNNILVTKWSDNKYLTEEQKKDFEAMRERAQRPNATRHDEYMYKVYYLGEFTDVAGAVFGNIEKCTKEYYNSLPVTEVYGVDFGFAIDGDPTTLIGCKIYNGKIYFNQYIYERGLTNDEELAKKIINAGVNQYSLIFGDYGGAGKGRMTTLITADNGRWCGDIAAGVPMQNAIKTNILDGLSQMLSMDGIVITTESKEMIEEFENYELDEKGKPHGDDHAIDAARYAAVYAKNYL